MFYDKFVIKDETNGLEASIHFNPTYDNSYTAMASGAAGAAAKGLAKGLGKLWGGSKKKEED